MIGTSLLAQTKYTFYWELYCAFIYELNCALILSVQANSIPHQGGSANTGGLL